MSNQTDDSVERSKLKLQNKMKKPPLNIIKNQNLRIIQKNLVYVIGLSSNIANKELLIKPEYFGQYGEITKLVVNKNKAYNPFGPNGPSYSAYITYSTNQEASIAILSIDNTTVDNHLLRASYGTTKYCSFYIKGLECTNKECLYLHYVADQIDIIHRDDMNSDKSIFLEQQYLAIKIADIYSSETRKKIKSSINSKINYILPTSETIFSKEIVIDNDPTNENYCKYNYYNKKNYCNKMYSGYEDYQVGNHEERNDYNDNGDNRRTSMNENSIDKLKSVVITENLLVSERKNSDSNSNANKTSASSNNMKLNSLFKSKNNDKSKVFYKDSAVNSKENELTPVVKQQFDRLSKRDSFKNSVSQPQDKSMTTEIKLQIDKKADLEVTRSKSDMTDYVPISQKQALKKKRTLFQKKEKSRFPFVEDVNSKHEDTIYVPDFIGEIINKKISLHYYVSKYSFDFDNNLEERILKNIRSDDWSLFILNLKRHCI